MTKITLDKQLEALLFANGDPVRVSRLCSVTKKKKGEVLEALETLRARLIKESGLRLIQKDESIQLVTEKSLAPLVGTLFKTQKREELSRASLEVLAIIAYSGPVSREAIERIRGVNSVYILRSLLMRGLIDERREDTDATYELSFETMRELGLSSPHELPDWPTIQEEIATSQSSLAEHKHDA